MHPCSAEERVSSAREDNQSWHCKNIMMTPMKRCCLVGSELSTGNAFAVVVTVVVVVVVVVVKLMSKQKNRW